jgi:chloride channel protein, CIC family
MRKRILEEVTLLVSVIKWSIYASVVGILVGGSTALFLKSLEWTTSLLVRYSYYFLILPLTLSASTLLVHWLAPDAQGHGTEKVIEAIHARSGKIPLIVVPVKLIATVITLASGGSAGKEGPCAQIGAGLASAFADSLKLDNLDRRKLVICGVSAGFASVFGTPVAGALFGVEVLFLGQLLYEVLFPSFVAGITGYLTASGLGVRYFHHPIMRLPPFTEPILFQTIVIGIGCGMVAFMLIESVEVVHRFFARLRWHRSFKALFGGALLVVIGFLASPQYLGLGLESIERGLSTYP